MVSAFPLSTPLKNYHDIYVPIEDAFGELMASFMKGGSRNMFKVMPVILQAASDYNNFTLNSPQFRRLVDERQHFDVAVVGYFLNDFVLGIGPLLKCPTVLYFSAGAGGLTNMVGNPAEVSSVPHLFLGNKNPMTFIDRVKNTLIHAFESIMVEYFKYKMQPYYE